MNIAVLLKKELARRTRSNPNYSMRAFARSLEISPSQLCEVLSGRKNVSTRSHEKISKKLGWNKLRRTAGHSGRALATLKWWHLAIHELANHEEVPFDPDFIARRFGLSVTTATLALEELVDNSLIRKSENDLIVAVPDRLFFGTGTPSNVIREFHKDTLQLANRQLDVTNYEDREYSFSLLGLNPDQVQEFRRRIREVVEEFASLAQRESGEKEIFGFGVQFYKVSNYPKRRNQ